MFQRYGNGLTIVSMMRGRRRGRSFIERACGSALTVDPVPSGERQLEWGKCEEMSTDMCVN